MRILIAAALIASPAIAAAQDQSLPEPRDYFCSLDSLVVVEDGRHDMFEDAYDDQKRPSRTTIPMTGKDGLIAETVSEDGSVYAYVKQHKDGLERYMIHGTFDFEAQKLVTARSILFPATDGTWVTEATSFTSLCEAVNPPERPRKPDTPKPDQ